MVEARFPQMCVSPEEKLRREIRAEKQQQRYLAMMASGTLPPGLEILEIPSTVAGQALRIAYKYPCKMRRISASERAARKNTATTTTAGTTALVGGSVLPGESSETPVENLKLEEIRISN